MNGLDNLNLMSEVGEVFDSEKESIKVLKGWRSKELEKSDESDCDMSSFRKTN